MRVKQLNSARDTLRAQGEIIRDLQKAIRWAVIALLILSGFNLYHALR